MTRAIAMKLTREDLHFVFGVLAALAVLYLFILMTHFPARP